MRPDGVGGQRGRDSGVRLVGGGGGEVLGAGASVQCSVRVDSIRAIIVFRDTSTSRTLTLLTVFNKLKLTTLRNPFWVLNVTEGDLSVAYSPAAGSQSSLLGSGLQSQPCNVNKLPAE